MYTLWLLLMLAASHPAMSALEHWEKNMESERKTTISKTNSLWTDCSTSSDPMTIYSLNISPIPLRRGNTLHAVLTANLEEEVEGGKISIVLRYNNVMTVLRKKMNLCNFVKKSGLSCPLEKGTLSFTYSMTIPTSVPPGQYSGSIIAMSKDGKELACIALNLNMGA